MNFDFTNLVPVEIVKEVKAKGKVATPKNPEGCKLRIFKDGSIYPSQQLVDQFALEYADKNSDSQRFGFDIWSSSDWGQYPTTAQQCVFISPVCKSEAKVSVFGSVDYNADGTPIKSVLTQGAKRPELVEMLREVYNKPFVGKSELGFNEPIDLLFLDKNYVDLDILTETVVFAGLENFYIPKTLKKGKSAGKQSYETRKNLTVMPLLISQVVEEVDYSEEFLGEAADSLLETQSMFIQE